MIAHPAEIDRAQRIAPARSIRARRLHSAQGDAQAHACDVTKRTARPLLPACDDGERAPALFREDFVEVPDEQITITNS